MAMVMPVFLLFLFAIIEFGHAMMIRSVLNAATRDGARAGSVGSTTTSQVVSFIQQRVSRVMNPNQVTISVRNASAFDNPTQVAAGINVDQLPTIELGTASSRQLYIVQASVNYNNVALIPPFWTTGLQLRASSVLRHE